MEISYPPTDLLIACGFCTVNGRLLLEVSPVTLFFTVTVKLPAASRACPEICVVLPLALMLQGVPQPGPLKYTVLLDGSKFCPAVPALVPESVWQAAQRVLRGHRGGCASRQPALSVSRIDPLRIVRIVAFRRVSARA